MVLMGTAEHNPPGAPEGNAGWALVPFLGTVLIFSTRQLFVGRGLAGQSLIASLLGQVPSVFLLSPPKDRNSFTFYQEGAGKGIRIAIGFDTAKRENQCNTDLPHSVSNLSPRGSGCYWLLGLAVGVGGGVGAGQFTVMDF